MWGCLRWLGCGSIALFALLALIVIGGWWYLGSSSFAGLVELRIESTLSSRLGRKVSVGSVEIVRRQGKVILNDLRIANAPGGIHPYFATVKQVVISGGIDSFWGRTIRVGRIDVVQPQLFFEVYGPNAKLAHNFPRWASGPKSRFEIYHLDLGTMYVTQGAFDFLDQRHKIGATATDVTSTIRVTSKEDVYAGIATSPLMSVRIQDYVPFNVAMRGEFRYTPNVLDLKSVALDGGPDLRIFINGRVAPLADAVYNLHLTSQASFARVAQIFRIQRTLTGALVVDSNLRGKQGTFAMTGGWASPHLKADVYDLTNLRGTLDVTDQRTIVDVQRAGYGGGTIAAHYLLPTYNEPYPMSVDLRYNGVSIEKLFSDWTIENSGLRAAATGHLQYHWNKDKILQGAGDGVATLSRSASAFSNAKYPIPIGGSLEYALDNGVVTFRRADLDTGVSRVAMTGKFRIENAVADLLLQIHTSDLAELDRIGYDLAHSAKKTTYDLLGLGGAGDVTGSISGPHKSPQVVAKIVATGAKYNNVLVGDADIDLRYDGVKSRLTFERANFREGNGHLAMTGTIDFPSNAPLRFDLAIDSTNYPADRAIALVNLKLALKGLGSGRMVVTGTPDEGKVTFAGMTLHEPQGDVRLNGSVAWLPGKGNMNFDLDVTAKNFPVADVVKFLDLGTLPVTGDMTGTLHIAGPKSKLEGRGAITVRNGTIYGEPVTEARANIAFTQGTMKATNVTLTTPAGSVTGEAEVNFGTNQFSYSIESGSIDLSKVKLLSSLAGLLGGNLTISSTGAGTLTQPELVLNATLNQTALKGINYPAGAPPPTLYVAIRNGQLIVKGSAAGFIDINGTGTVAPDGTLSGLVQVRVSDIAKALALSPSFASLPASGSMTMNLALGGKMSSLEAIRIDATFPEFNLKVSEHTFTPARPLRIGMRDGRIVFDDFDLALGGTGSTFAVTGFAELSGAKRLDVNVRGEVEAALLQLFVPGLRADGHVIIALGATGTISNPRLTGTAEMREAEVRFPGFPQLFDHIDGTLVFRGDRLDIDSLKANVGGGQVVIGGTVALDGLKPQNARVVLHGTEVALRYFEGLTVEGNFDVVLSGDANRMILQGDITVNRGTYFRDTDLGSMILGAVLARRGPTPIVAASWQDKVSLRLHVTSADTLAIRNNIADITGSADLEVTGTLGNPSVLGLVSLDEGGRVRFQNIDYTLVRGTINFQNPFRIDPYFDITLESRVSGGLSELESGPIDITLNITGTLDRITPTITSDPPASDITLFSLIGVGGLTRSSNGQPIDASTAKNSILYQSLSLLGSKVLPFADAFAIDPGNLDTTGDSGTKVSMQKRVSNAITIYFVYNLKDTRTRAVLEWQVNPDWVLQFTRDDFVNEYRVEARFRRRYEGHWAWGSLGRTPMALFASFRAPSGAPAAPPAEVAPPLPSPTDTTGLPPPTGARVTTVTFRADANFDTSVLSRYVSVRPGQPLSIRDVQSSIKSLFSTGDFRDVRVEQTPATGGVAITFVMSINYRVSDIRFDGVGGADRTRALREITVHLGDVLSLDAVDHSADAVQDFLVRSGFLDATVDPETTFDRQQSRATVIFHVNRGEPARVGTVTIDGNVAPFTTDTLIKQMHRGPGKLFRIADARTDAERMRTYMIRRDYRKSTVRFDKYTYDKASHQVALRYLATSGPIVHVEVTGVTRRSLRGILPFSKNQAYSEDVIDRAADDIVTHLQGQGFYNAAVDTEEHLDNNIWTTTFHVRPGQHYKLTAVTFSGNIKVSSKVLAGVVTTSARGGFKSLLATIFRRPSGVTRAQLTADRDALESYYRLQGFSDVRIGTPVVDARPDGTMIVTFPIDEGVQTIVREVRVEGNEQVKSSDLPKLTLRAGDPLNPQVERADLVALQSFYADRGNAEVQIKPREELSPDKREANITYVIAEGPKVDIAKVVVRGNTYTKTNVVLKQSDISSGDPFSYSSILEAQRNLYRLGIFQRVDIQPEQAGTEVSKRNVVISVEEGKDLTIAASGGLTSGITRTNNAIVPLGSVSIAHRNLFGTGRYLGLELVAAKGDREDAFLTYREPFIGPFNTPLQITAFQSDDIRRGAQLRQRGLFAEVTKVSRFQTRWSLRYEYRLSQCVVREDNDLCAQAKEALLPGFDRSFANVKISDLTPTFFWDRRDDPLDPHRGFFTSASLQYAFRVLDADAHFLKEFAQGSYYIPLTSRSVFAVASRVGFIQDYGGGFDESGLHISGVPLSERFTGGGESSHRAFPLDLLGTTCADPREGSDCHQTLLDIIDQNGNHVIAPLGGRSIFIANMEYRFPIAGPIGGAAFVDAGNVFDARTINFAKLRYGIGSGIRYLSPVGPIRFDVGYKLNRRILRYDSSNKPIYERPFAYFITIGYAF